MARANETPNRREVRLEKERARASTSRAHESPKCGRIRLLGNRMRATATRQNIWANLNLEAFAYKKTIKYRFIYSFFPKVYIDWK